MFPAGRRFVGRAEALERLAQHVGRGARLVTIWGPGGVGKTRLASQFATHGAHGLSAWFCELSDARDAAGIASAVARTFDLPLTAGATRDAVQQIGRALAHRPRALVVLDNFEQITAHAAATVGRWIEQAPQARFIVTSRERLGLSGEVLLELPPLPLDSDAIDLFVERVRASNPEFQVTDAMKWDIADIVRRLDGLPLAIELAAARVAVLGLEGLRARLEKRLDVLTRGAAGAPKRQATLRGALEWSWDLLSSAERDALAAASVFRGGFSLESAESVLGPEAVERLESLRDKALLLSAQDPEFPGRMRFGFFDTVREFAASKLDGVVRAGVEQRHRAHFRARAAVWRKEARGASSDVALREIATEQANLLHVIEGCLSGDHGDPACALDVALALDPVLATRGSAQQRLELFDAVLASAKQEGRDAAAALLARGVAHRMRGNAGDAQRDFDEARKQARAARAPEEEAAAALESGILAHERRDMPRAQALYEEALATSLDRRTQARALGNLGAVFHDLGRFDEARERYEIALDLCVQASEGRLEGLFRFNLAILEQERGDMLQSQEQFRRAIAKLASVRDRRLHAIARSSLGTLLQESGDWTAALALHDDALRALREAGDVRSEGLALARAGACLAMLGRTAEARDALDESERLLLTLADEVALGASRLQRAFLDLVAIQEAVVRGDAAARTLHREALEAKLRAAREPAHGKPSAASLSDDVRIALRILDRSAGANRTKKTGPRLRVGPNAEWIEAPKRRREDLSRHAAARRILLKLLEEKRIAPGNPSSLDALREAGWPGERLSPDAAANRTHVALALLRKKGLKDLLTRTEAGYFLAPAIEVEWDVTAE